MAYALGVLALALAPAPSAASGLPSGILLCSGAPAPSDGQPAVPAGPLGELGHCKGCPHNPVIGGPPLLATAVASPAESRVALPPVQQDGRHPLFATGLPPSRAPPAS